MSLSTMNSTQKAIVAVLAVIIVISLLGIGLLVARLVVGTGEGDQATGGATTVPVGATVAPVVTSEEPAEPAATDTPVPNPTLVEVAQEPPEPVGGQRVEVVQVESPAPLLPAILQGQVLHGTHRYQVVITTQDGSNVRIKGSWSQSAKGEDGRLELPLPEFIGGMTPFTLDITSPLENPKSWSLSVSASPKDLLTQPPGLVITVWDVTGTE